MRLYTVFLLFLALSLSSCFEVIEEINLDTNGSGSYEYTLNMSQSRTRLSQIMRLDSINGYKVPKQEDLQEPIRKLVEKAKSVEGISNVELGEDFDNFIFSFSCDFDNIETMNDLVAELAKGQKTGGAAIETDHFSYDKTTKTLTRKGDYQMKRDFDKVREADKLIFSGAKYTSIFRTTGEIVSQDNGTAKVSPNKKAILFQADIMDIVNEDVQLGNTIKIK